uniref:Leiomodin-3 n=1 Tax=Fundulus heteroclitus TaxID=8078 RepID=A0A3Q2SY29_FUNHE
LSRRSSSISVQPESHTQQVSAGLSVEICQAMAENDLDREDLSEEEIDEDAILAMLSPEELNELQSEMDVIIAPDENVPVGQRQRDQTEKTPTGTFDHRSLVDYLYWEKESKRMLEEERVPATLLPSEVRENSDVKYEVYEEIIEEDEGETERDKVVDVENETSEEVVLKLKPENTDKKVEPPDNIEKTAGNTMVESQSAPDSKVTSENHQDKEEHANEDCLVPRETAEVPDTSEANYNFPKKEPIKVNKLKIPKLALNNIKMTSRPSGNETNLESTLDKIRNNNPSVTEVNLNNIENIPKEMLVDYVNALKKNKHVKTFSIANTGADENIAFSLANMLRENRSITTLNIESNFITGKGIVAIIRCLQFNETLTELRFHNQRHMLGHHAEMEISRLLKANNTLLKIGYHFEQAGPRMVVTNILTRNLDRQRQLRKEDQRQQQVKEQREMMQMYENSLNLPPGLLEMLGYIPPLELLQQHGLVPPMPEQNNIAQTQCQSEQPEPKKNLKRNSIPKQPSAEPSSPLKDIQLKRTPKKRDPFLDLDPREDRRSEKPSFQLRKTPKVKDKAARQSVEEKANLNDVIKTLKPIPRRRVPPKVDLTPRDQLLDEIKKSNVAYLKSVPLPKVLESSETSLF